MFSLSVWDIVRKSIFFLGADLRLLKSLLGDVKLFVMLLLKLLILVVGELSSFALLPFAISMAK